MARGTGGTRFELRRGPQTREQRCRYRPAPAGSFRPRCFPGSPVSWGSLASCWVCGPSAPRLMQAHEIDPEARDQGLGVTMAPPPTYGLRLAAVRVQDFKSLRDLVVSFA